MKVRTRDGSGFREYKFLVRDVDRYGKTRIYFRRKGEAKIRLVAEPGTAEFHVEYISAVNRLGLDKRTGTVSWLAECYYSSITFEQLEVTTRRVRRRILDAIDVRLGSRMIAQLRVEELEMLRDEKRSAPAAANARIKALRALFKWGCKQKLGGRPLISRNPANEIEYLPPHNKFGHHTWTRDEILQYRARHPLGTKARLALDLLFYTGVRISDVVRLGPPMERAGIRGDDRKWLHFTEKKNARSLPKQRAIPIEAPLRRSIATTRTGHHLTYLMTKFGETYASEKAFANRFKSWCAQAGLPTHCTAHGVRKAAATIAAENGATHDDLKAMFGWTTSKMVDHYTRLVQQRRLVAKSMRLISLDEDSLDDSEHAHEHPNEIRNFSRDKSAN
jgi:integrase